MDRYDKTGIMEAWWLGQMGLMLRSGKTTLCIDYYATPDANRQVPPPIAAEALEGVDIFLGTHDHLDHIDHEAWKIWAGTNPNAKFVFPRAHTEAVLADGISPENAVGDPFLWQDRSAASADQRTRCREIPPELYRKHDLSGSSGSGRRD